jgi:hypothetical protein
MKYYSELSEIETQIIRLSSVSSVLRVISIGAEQANAEDVRNALWYIEGSIEDIHDCLRARFDDVWDAVRDDVTETTEEEFDEDEDDHYIGLDIEEPPKNRHKGGMKKKKQLTDRDL